MKFPISPHIRKVHPPPISEVKGWLAGCTPDLPLVDLCQAVPDYPPHADLTDHLKQLLDDPLMAKYSLDEGLPEVRETVCERYRRRYGAALNPAQICLTIGASQAFWLAVTVLCRAGDEVIVQLPAYFDHPMALQALGIRCVYAPFHEETHGMPDIADIARRITPRTRAILLVTPGNPTGAIIPPEALEELFELVRNHNIALVLDETYGDFIPGGAPPHGLFARPDWSGNFVQVISFGKTYALTGYRAGALVAAEAFINQALKVQDSMVVCQPRITQHAIRYGIEHLDGWVTANCAMMARRHDRFVAEFSQPGNPFTLAASGAFFGWVHHPYAGRTGRQVARMLVEKAGVLTLPGEVFGPGLENYLRLAFGNIHDEAISGAVRRFRECAGEPPAG